jgi:hypothetical protein
MLVTPIVTIIVTRLVQLWAGHISGRCESEQTVLGVALSSRRAPSSDAPGYTGE